MRYLKPGDRILGRYEIGNWLEIGEGRYITRPYQQGGLGVVYRAYDLDIGDPVVLKTYKGPVSRSSQQAKLFREEAETWIRLGQHHHIVRAFDVFEYDARYYIVIEFVLGGNLRTRIGRLNVNEGLQIALGICRGMLYASETLTMVHRDLKPENILLASEGTSKITDFGLARIFDEERLPRPGPAGTRGYMAPEQLLDARKVDTRADIYAFGVVLHEMLTGRRPQGSLGLPERLVGDATPILKRLIECCLRTEPQERLPNFRIVLEELEPVADALGIEDLPQIDSHNSDLIHDSILSVPSIELWIRAKNFFNIGKFEDAIACYSELLQEEPDRAYVLSRRGHAYLELGRYREAEADIDEALALAPKDPHALSDALLGKGDLYGKQGDLKQAIHYYDAALQTDRSRWGTATQHKAVLMEQAGDHFGALECYDALLEQEPTADLSVSKALVLERIGRLADALTLCEEALQMEPNSMRAVGLKAHLHTCLNQPREALAAFQRILREDPEYDRPWLFNRIGTCYADLGDYPEALRHHIEVYQLAPDNASYLFNCALDGEKLNRWSEVAQLYRSYVAICPTSAEGCYRLGKALAETGDFQAACQALDQCLSLEDHPDGRFLLDYIKREFAG